MQIPIFLDTIEGIGLRQRSDLLIEYHTEYYTLVGLYLYMLDILYDIIYRVHLTRSRVTKFLIVVQKSAQ